MTPHAPRGVTVVSLTCRDLEEAPHSFPPRGAFPRPFQSLTAAVRRPYILRTADNQRVILAFSPVNSIALCDALRTDD
jgi:hypothetical protein